MLAVTLIIARIHGLTEYYQEIIRAVLIAGTVVK